MNPVDQIELDLLDLTGDLELAELGGRVAVESIRNSVAAIAMVVGLDTDALIADVMVSLGISATHEPLDGEH